MEDKYIELKAQGCSGNEAISSISLYFSTCHSDPNLQRKLPVQQRRIFTYAGMQEERRETYVQNVMLHTLIHALVKEQD